MAHYTINVAKDGKHVFATAEHSGYLFLAKAMELFELIESKFPVSEGYTVDISYTETKSRKLNLSI